MAPMGAGVAGVVAAGSPHAAEAAATLLRCGGNAFDATLAAGLAAAVAEPCLTSLAGGGFLTAHACDGAEFVVDFFTAVPGRGAGARHDPAELECCPVDFGGVVQDFHVGPASVAVPGVLAGYLAVHEKFGRVELAEVAAPAVALGRSGLEVDRAFDRLISLLHPVLGRTAEGRGLFFRDGRPLGLGDRFTNPAMSQFLEDLAAGRRHGFEASELGPAVTAQDVAGYSVEVRQPLEVDLAGARLWVNPAPSLGGRLVAEGLARWAETGVASFDADDPASVVALGEALVHMVQRRTDLGPGTSRGTTHVSVIDAEGNAVAMTTSNGSGSGEFAAGLGVQLNNMMGEEDLHPGGFGSLEVTSRIPSMMCPSVLSVADRRVSLGSGGSERIRSVVLQVVLRLLSGGGPPQVPLRSVVDAPRLHWDGAAMQAEPGWSPEVLGALARHWPVNEWAAGDLYFGGAHLASSNGEAAGDPRRGGVALVVAAE